LVAIEEIINITWKTNSSTAKLFDNNMNRIIEINSQYDNVISALKNANKNDTLYKAQEDFLELVNSGTNIYQGKYYDAISKLIGLSNNNSLTKVKSYTDRLKKVYDFIKLFGTDYGPVMASTIMLKSYTVIQIKDWDFYKVYADEGAS